ncbi:MAG: hypothetical protein CBD98_003630 [Flavobacteriaceae bacterium TMED238]|nr:MAG: hypothetical protein CBD98_003630 [Flavobacteriaceae bacterium TMED238]|tara:strand:- start:274 stop:1083 length:810 start_codon:yes stop_codon:yes gene_type:complete
MKKYLYIVLLVFFWSCEDEKSETKIIFSSVNNGDALNYKPNSIILSFNDRLTENDFDADSYENYKSIYASPSVPDTIDVDGTLILDLVDYFYKVENSNFIKLNNQPQTFIYDSTTKTCLLMAFTTEFFPDGTGEGLSLQEGDNQLIIGAFNEINFSVNQTNINDVKVVPNISVPSLGFFESEHMREVRFTYLPENAIIDIFKVEEGYYVNRIIHNNQLFFGNIPWDLRDFNNSEVSSGIYQYSFGIDTTNTGDLIKLKMGYFLIIHNED